jgi:hypothetical protein
MKLKLATITVLIPVIVFQLACGGLAALLVTAKVVTAADAPVLARLEQRGIITHAQNLAVDKFLKDTSANIDQTNTEWKAATNRAGQVTAIENSVSREAQLVNGLTALPPEVQAIIGDVSAVFQVIAAFYGVQMPPAMRPPLGASMPVVHGSDLKKQLENQIKMLHDRLQ